MGTLCHSYPTSPPLSASLPWPPSLLQQSESQRLRMWVFLQCALPTFLLKGLRGRAQLGLVRRRCHCPEPHLEVEASASDLSQAELKSEWNWHFVHILEGSHPKPFSAYLGRQKRFFFFSLELSLARSWRYLYSLKEHILTCECASQERRAPLYQELLRSILASSVRLWRGWCIHRWTTYDEQF